MWFWRLALGTLVAVAPIANVADAQTKKPKKEEKKPAKKEAPAATPKKDEAPAAPAAEAAPAKKADAEYQVAYGMAGCGLGSMIFKENSKGQQIGAWFLNELIGFKLSNLSCTKGSSNCDKGPDLRTAQMEQKVFLEVNFASLSREAAQGGGQHLNAFASILGCNDAARSRFMEVSRTHYGEIFATDNPDQVFTNFQTTIQSDAALHEECSRAIALTAAI